LRSPSRLHYTIINNTDFKICVGLVDADTKIVSTTVEKNETYYVPLHSNFVSMLFKPVEVVTDLIIIDDTDVLVKTITSTEDESSLSYDHKKKV